MNKLDNYLLSNYYLSLNNEEIYQLLEIEIYLYNESHLDIFTHCHSNLKRYWYVYFHQLSKKEHSYKAGILIRGILTRKR